MDQMSAIHGYSNLIGTATKVRRSEMVDRSTILVVDDDYAILQMLELMLEDAGYNVVKASDGKEALELVRLYRPDLVLVDLMMPNMDGCAVCETIRNAEDTRCLPVLIMSASRDVADRALRSKANGYFLKPFDMDDILGRVENWLTESEQCEPGARKIAS